MKYFFTYLLNMPKSNKQLCSAYKIIQQIVKHGRHYSNVVVV